MAPSSLQAESQLKKSIHPLRVRDFRLLWIGESISLLGDQFYLIALPWLVLQLTGDAFALGTVMALAGVPRALFMVIGGAFVDRFSPRTVMFASNLARMVLVGMLSLFVLSSSIQLWMLYLLALAFGMADAFYFPAQSAILPQLLGDDQLQMGNTLTQGVATLSMFVGPVVAGILIAILGGQQSGGAESTPSLQGIGLAFALDALSFLASLLTLQTMRVQKPSQPTAQVENVLSAIHEGIAFVWKSTVLRMVFILMIGINFLVTGPFEVGIPVLADHNLTEGAAAFGILMSAYGGGALLGLILAGALPKPKPSIFGPIVLSTTGLLGIGMLLLPFSTSTLVVALVSLGMGTAMGFVNIHFTTWLQKRIPDQLMGRVMSLLMFAWVGVAPISSTIAGAILHVDLLILFAGAGILMTGLAFGAALLPTARQMGLEVEEIEKRKSIAEALGQAGEVLPLRSSGNLPAIRL